MLFIKNLKFLIIFLFLIIIYVYNNNSNKNNLPLIGIVQVVSHQALDSTRKGIIDELKSNGFIHKKNVLIEFESAQNNPALATQIVQKFIGNNAKVIVAIGTSVAQSALQTLKKLNRNTNLIFASVTDPISAKLSNKYYKNIFGVSNYVSSKKQFEYFINIMPSLKNIGIIYNPGESNSVFLINDMKKAAKDLGLNLMLVTANKTSEVSLAASSIIAKVDAIFINNDNTALCSFNNIKNIAKENNKPVFTSDTCLVEKGAFAAIGANQYELGRQAGKYVLDALNNKELPKNSYEYPKNFEKLSLKK